MIYIDKLTEQDIGRTVIYTEGTGSQEEGEITSFNKRFIFVDYWDGSRRGKATYPGDLAFITKAVTISCVKDLNDLDRKLNIGDIIIFKVEDKELKYVIRVNYLISLKKQNGIIFDLLGLNRDEKYKLASECYGYKSYFGSGEWPEYKVEDYNAVERLIRELYYRLGDFDEREGIQSRFEILDIGEIK